MTTRLAIVETPTDPQVGRRLRMAMAANRLSNREFAVMVSTATGKAVSHEKIRRIAVGESDPTLGLIEVMGELLAPGLANEIANPVEWLKGAAPEPPPTTQALPGYINTPGPDDDHPTYPGGDLVEVDFLRRAS